ncbi:MAG: hypothetical protein LQ348_000273 [Seirophora lacunosa]|nr:MAG: hypothetical protein LQ344_001517 [Seirophora lacunosa]KAI4208210.1 MAG: hypothetical protein LQ348_000273 [Seirophora lacunosa]
MTQTQDVELDAASGPASHQAAPEAPLLPEPNAQQSATPPASPSPPPRVERSMARTLLPSFTGFIAALTTLAILSFVVMLAVVLTLQRRKPCILALVSSIIEVLSWCTIVYMLLCHIRQRKSFGGSGEHYGGRGRHSLLFALGMLPSIIGGIAIGALLGWANTSRSEVPSYVLGLKISTYLFVSFILWGVSVISQIFFFACLAWASNPVPKSIQDPSFLARDEHQEMTERSRPTTSTTVQSNPFRGEPSSSSAPSAPPSEAASLRSSLSIKARPSTAKGKLSNRQLVFQARSSLDSPAIRRRPSQDEAFDSWDTSGVGSHIRETVLQSSPALKAFPLEPIPGSRSPSPAKALEGPFFSQVPSDSPPPSPLPQPPVSRPVSRARSASSEDHIHPLFRTYSPGPTPQASSNTVVTAAPGAGQLINQRILKRMRSGSLPSSPSPLIRSESFSDFMASRTPTSPRSPHSPSQEYLRSVMGQEHRPEHRPFMPGRFPSAVSATSQLSQTSQVSQETVTLPTVANLATTTSSVSTITASSVPVISSPIPRSSSPLLRQAVT